MKEKVSTVPPDFVETMKSVRLEVEALGAGENRPRVRAVQDGEIEEAVGRAEDLPEHLRARGWSPPSRAGGRS